jgi:hypothetical protein
MSYTINSLLGFIMVIFFACSKPQCPSPEDVDMTLRCSNGIKDGSEQGIDCGGACGNVCSQAIVVLQPGPGAGIDALVRTDFSTTFNTAPLQIYTWNGIATRSLLNFDYSSLPASATITHATLTLFADTTTDYSNGEVLPGHSGDNSFKLEHITAPWNDQTVNWVNQPSANYYSRIVLPASTSRDQAYVIDVTAILKKEFEDGTHYGFVLSNSRTVECAAVFYSSEGIYPQLRPKMELEYSY